MFVIQLNIQITFLLIFVDVTVYKSIYNFIIIVLIFYKNIYFYFYIDKTLKSFDTISSKSVLTPRSPDELALHQQRRNLFKLGKNQDQALKGMVGGY